MDFSANLNPEGTPEAMKQAIRSSMDEIGFYPDVQMTETKQHLSDFLSFPKEHILPTNGGIGALQLIVERERPSTAVILQPAFVEYEHLCENVGAKLVHIPILKNDVVHYDVEAIESAMEPGAMVFICNPSNPLGSVMDRSMLISLLEIAKEKEALVVLDEAFIDYCDDLSCRSLILQYDHLIVAGSLTKMFAIPGIRLGYVLASAERLARYRHFQAPWSLSAQGVGAARALPQLKDFVEASAQKNRQRRMAMKDELEGLGFLVFPSEGNYLLAKIPWENGSVEELQAILREDRILIRDCSNYQALGNRYFRVGIKGEEANAFLLDRLSAAMAQLLKGSVTT
jgi:threonine-phosphate decarboxylase